jgi:hypothetical protein
MSPKEVVFCLKKAMDAASLTDDQRVVLAGNFAAAYGEIAITGLYDAEFAAITGPLQMPALLLRFKGDDLRAEAAS